MATKLCLYNELHGSVATTSQPVETAFPIGNVVKYDNDLIARYASVASATNVAITATLTELKDIGAVIIDKHTISGNITVTFNHDSTLQHTETISTHVSLDDTYKRSSAFFTPVRANKVKIAFALSTSAKVTVGYLMAGKDFIPANGAQYGTYIESNVNSSFQESAGGSEFIDYSTVKNLGNLIFNALTKIEATTAKRAIAKTVENNLPVFASLFAGDGDDTERSNQILGYVHSARGPRLLRNVDWSYNLHVIEGSKNLK